MQRAVLHGALTSSKLADCSSLLALDLASCSCAARLVSGRSGPHLGHSALGRVGGAGVVGDLEVLPLQPDRLGLPLELGDILFWECGGPA